MSFRCFIRNAGFRSGCGLFQYVDFRGDYDLALKRLLRTLPTGLTLPQAVPVQKETAPAVSTQASVEPTAEPDRAQEPVGDLPPAEREIVPAVEQILLDNSEEPGGDQPTEAEQEEQVYTEIVESEHTEEKNETSKEQARERKLRRISLSLRILDAII